MVWEAVFFLIVLKIPTVYLGFVVWWAVRGERDKDEPVAVAVISDTPPDGPGHGLHDRPARRPLTTRPHGRPVNGRPTGRTRVGARQ